MTWITAILCMHFLQRGGWFDPCGSHGSFQVHRKSKHTIGFGSVSCHLWTQSHLFSILSGQFLWNKHLDPSWIHEPHTGNPSIVKLSVTLIQNGQRKHVCACLFQPLLVFLKLASLPTFFNPIVNSQFLLSSPASHRPLFSCFDVNLSCAPKKVLLQVLTVLFRFLFVSVFFSHGEGEFEVQMFSKVCLVFKRQLWSSTSLSTAASSTRFVD